jgi:feruloyl esterase
MLDQSAMSLLHRAALAACDADDGLADGVIENPPACRFDPASLQCGEGSAGAAACLSAAQVAAARAIYASPPNPETGRPITGLFPGSEAGWSTWGGPQPFQTAVDHYRYVVHGNADWTPAQFRFEVDAPRAEKQDGNTINALNTDLRPFFRRGGKVLQYHGWSDPQISPGISPQFHESVLKRIGDLKGASQSYRLFMVPGMAHCGGGDGASRFDMLTVLENWVERGERPEEIQAQRERQGRVDRTRKLCAYPRIARYAGQGDPDAAESFRCVNP